LPRRLIFLIVAMAAALGVAVTPDIAGAHGDEGEMTVTAIEERGTNRVFLGVGIKYTNDAELAQDAHVIAVATGPGGAALPAVDLPRISGARYEATITVPSAGTWTFTITSVEPNATATATIDIAAAATTTSPTASTAPPTTGAPSTGATTPSTTPPSSGTEDAQDTDGSPSKAPLIAAVATVGLLVLAGAIAFARSRRTAP